MRIIQHTTNKQQIKFEAAVIFTARATPCGGEVLHFMCKYIVCCYLQ